MIKRLIYGTFGYILVIAVIGYVTAFVMGEVYGTGAWEYTFVSQQNYQIGSYTATFWVFDARGYLTNLQSQHSLIVDYAFPDFPKIWLPRAFDLTALAKAIPNYFIFIANVWIWLMNLLLVLPTKLLISPIYVGFTLIGINTEKLGFYNIVQQIYSLNIQQIAYWN